MNRWHLIGLIPAGIACAAFAFMRPESIPNTSRSAMSTLAQPLSNCLDPATVAVRSKVTWLDSAPLPSVDTTPSVVEAAIDGKVLRDTQTARGILKGKWLDESGRNAIYFNWPEVVTVNLVSVEGDEPVNESKRPDKTMPAREIRRVTRWVVTMGTERRDRATMTLQRPYPERSIGGIALSQYEIQFDFSQDFQFAMVTQDRARLGKLGPNKLTWSDELAPVYAAADTKVWIRQDKDRKPASRLFHKRNCESLKAEKGKLVEATISEAGSKFNCSPCDRCNPQLAEPAPNSKDSSN
jgi:hypothetical protein